MQPPLPLPGDFDWKTVPLAVGSAVDAPMHLAALLRADPAGRRAAIGYLRDKVVCDGTILGGTAPVALCLANMLDDRRLDGDHDGLPTRAAVLQWLYMVAVHAREAGEYLDAEGTDGWDQDDLDAVTAALAMRAAAFAEVERCLHHRETMVRRTAVIVVGEFLAAAELEPRRPAVAALLGHLTHDTDPATRAATALVLDRLGVSPGALLTDPHPGVRVCAAAARMLDDEPAALAEVRRAAGDVAAVAAWFDGEPSILTGEILHRLSAATERRTGQLSATMDFSVFGR